MLAQNQLTFAFGNNSHGKALSSIEVDALIAADNKSVRFAAFEDDVPLLFGMSNLSNLGAIIDTSNKRVCFLKVFPRVFDCEVLPG